MQVPDEVVDGIDENGVEPRGRLVEEDDLGLGHEGPRDGHALAHAPRDLRRVLAAHLLEPHLLELLLDPLRDLRGPELRLLAQGKGDVVEDRHGIEQGAALEDHPVAPPHRLEGRPAQPRDVHPIHEHGARVRAHEAQEVLEEHGLAPAAPADDDHDLARGHVQIHALEHFLAAEGLAQALDPNHASEVTGAPSPGSS